VLAANGDLLGGSGSRKGQGGYSVAGGLQSPIKISAGRSGRIEKKQSRHVRKGVSKTTERGKSLGGKRT